MSQQLVLTQLFFFNVVGVHYDGDEEVENEFWTNDHEDYEEEGPAETALILRIIVYIHRVWTVVHVLFPAFCRGADEEA